MRKRRRWRKLNRARAKVTALYPGLFWDKDCGYRPGRLVAVGEWR